MAHAPETKAAVRASFIFDRMSLEQAAEKHDVPLATARRWKMKAGADGDDWERARAASSLSQTGVTTIAQLVLADYLALHQSTVEGVKADVNLAALAKAETLSRLADAFSKTMAAVAKAAPDLGRFAVATEMMQDLAVFVRESYPQHAPALAEVLEPFAIQIAKKYG